MFETIANEIRAIGTSDADLDLFENQYPLSQGVTYNSYIINSGGVTAVIDTADQRRGAVWLANVENAAAGASVDYLIVHHMEPDHSSMIGEFCKRYPDAKVVATAQAIKIIGQFFPELDLAGRTIAVKDGDTINVGSHPLTFVGAPMVHWPEVIVTFDPSTGTLFSADAFGTFGTATTIGELWPDEARRYYCNIVGKYGPNVQRLLAKAKTLPGIDRIAPLHGPVVAGADMAEALRLYDLWSSYTPELPDGVLVAYASIYGNTAAVALEIARRLEVKGHTVSTIDLCRQDVSYAVAEAFRMGTIVVASSTYDAGMFPAMHSLLYHLQIKNLQRRRFAVVENGSWAPTAAKAMKDMIGQLKECTIVEPTLTIRSSGASLPDATLDAFMAAL